MHTDLTHTDLLHEIFEHELNELNEFFIKTCDSKIIRVIRIIRVQKNSWSKDLVVKKSVRVRSVCVYKKDPRAK